MEAARKNGGETARLLLEKGVITMKAMTVSSLAAFGMS